MALRDIAVRLTNVTKRFKLYHNPITGPIKECVFFWTRDHYYEEFMAIKDVSLHIQRGEVVGIIGPNGAGKSTLLKMIAGLLHVDAGKVEVNGKLTALLALGVGVHPEFSGKENILYHGMLLGMSKKEVLRKLPEIIEFAELGEYIDRPFRTYSSGMKARLLFSTSMSVSPDILIVDEALATGDAYFIHKSSSRIRELCESGATIIFVSHNLRQIEELCSRCVVLQKGQIEFDGDTREAINTYIQSVHKSQTQELAKKTFTRVFLQPTTGTGQILLRDIYFVVDGRRTERVVIGKACELHIDYEALEDLPQAKVLIEVRSEKTPTTYAFVPPIVRSLVGEGKDSDGTFSVKQGKGKVVFSFSKLVLGDGGYSCDIEFFPGSEDYQFSYDSCYCYYAACLNFHAVYEHNEAFGRGTITEIPVESIRVEVISG